MVIRELLNKLSAYRSGIDLKKFQEVSKQCAADPSNSYKILKKEFLQEIREVAIKRARKAKEDWKNLSLEEKEGEIANQEKELWQQIKNHGHTALGIIFGISISS